MTFWRKIIASMTGSAAYPELIRTGTGRAMGYLALWLLLVVALAGMGSVGRSLQPARALQVAMVRLPDFGLRGGEVYFEGQMPYKVDMGDDGVFIVDTGASGADQLKDYSRGILVTKNHVYQKSSGGVEDTDLSPLRTANFSVSRSDLIRYAGYWPGFVAFFQVFRYAWNLAAKLLAALILGLIGLAAGRQVIGFEGTFTAALYALTLPAAIDILAPRPFPNSGWLITLVYWGLGIAFTWGGVKAARHAAAGPPVDIT